MGRTAIYDFIDEATEWAIGIRHDFHRWPELGNQEYKTSMRIRQELESLGIETEQVLDTGVVAVINKSHNKKVVAIRADMDALPIQEEVLLPYASERRGMMHACGHDVHMAVLLGTARVLNEIKDHINGTIKLIFQPAEETTGGAERMIKKGCLENPKVDYILGLHVKPDLPAGTLGLKYGKVHASSDTFRIIVKGKASHGAYPELGVDAIVTAAHLVANAQSIISRNVSPLNPAVVTFGSFHGGNAVNIIADQVVLEGTIRALDKNTRDFLKSRLREMVRNTSKAAGAVSEIVFTKGYSALTNDNLIVDIIKEVGLCERGIDKVVELKEPSMGVEDFSYFLEKIPGAFFFLGSGYKGRENDGIHSGKFEVDEKCIRAGILMETLSAINLLE